MNWFNSSDFFGKYEWITTNPVHLDLYKMRYIWWRVWVQSLKTKCFSELSKLRGGDSGVPVRSGRSRVLMTDAMPCDATASASGSSSMCSPPFISLCLCCFNSTCINVEIEELIFTMELSLTWHMPVQQHCIPLHADWLRESLHVLIIFIKKYKLWGCLMSRVCSINCQSINAKSRCCVTLIQIVMSFFPPPLTAILLHINIQLCVKCRKARMSEWWTISFSREKSCLKLWS